MKIKSFEIVNYKSFLSTDAIPLTSGFNVIVGQNNVGKTALIEVLSLRFDNKPHRSLRVAPRADTPTRDSSQITVRFEVDKDELTDLLMSNLSTFFVPLPPDQGLNVETEAQRFIETYNVAERHSVLATFSQAGQAMSAAFDTQDYAVSDNQAQALRFRIDRDSKQPSLVAKNVHVVNRDNLMAFQLASVLRSRVYAFRAERLIRGDTSEAGANTVLDSGGANLPEVLHRLQGSSPKRFERFLDLVKEIIPDIEQMSVDTTSGRDLRILLWPANSDPEREDLAVPLTESGTGVGQVLAILYVVYTSPFPRTIIIDEPQSFLHPGAIRKLFDLLKRRFSHHQYIVATHSPTVVTAAEPQTLLLVRKEGPESMVQSISIEEAQSLRLFLSEIGARLADVFGADNILWVEGATEECCFPLILARLGNQSLLGTQILGVRQTGDLEGRQARAAFEIYRRLSTGRGILPPAIGFVFDREGRTQRERDDLVREGRGLVHFLPRRMYENYLLHAGAIAAVASTIEGLCEDPSKALTSDEVKRWIEERLTDKKYLRGTPRDADGGDNDWERDVHGADVLKDLFVTLSENRITYDKVEHGTALTRWILDNDPDQLVEVADLLERMLAENPIVTASESP